MGVRLTPDSVVDFLAVESYLNGLGYKKLTKLLNEKSIQLSTASVRRLKNERRAELEQMILRCQRRLANWNKIKDLGVGVEKELEVEHTRVSFRIIDVMVSRMGFSRVEDFYKGYISATAVTVKALFELDADFDAITTNVELVDAFKHHRELSEGQFFDDKLRLMLDEILEGFRILRNTEFPDIHDTSVVDKATRMLEQLYELSTKELDQILKWDLRKNQFFFISIKGMLGPDDDYLNWEKSARQ